MTLRLVKAEHRHAKLVAASMRPRDVQEVMQGWGCTPERGMRMALSESYYSRTLFADLEPLAMYGLAPLQVLGGQARLWMFCTSAIDRHPLVFCRASKRHLGDLLAHCTLATNLIAWDDAPARKWLEWLGAEYVGHVQQRGGRPFRQFVIAKKHRPERAESCRQG